MKLNAKQKEELLSTLNQRFEKNKHRHPEIQWENVLEKIESNKKAVESLAAMEESGGEPDVMGLLSNKKEIVFCDFSKETPSERRNMCYDLVALKARKKFPPDFSAMEKAEEMGVEILSEEEYRSLLSVEELDLKTSSWLKTPKDIRSKGGAIFGDYRYGSVFIYHNGADSYYGVRGFRCKLVLK